MRMLMLKVWTSLLLSLQLCSPTFAALFERRTTYAVCQQLEENCNTDTTTNAVDLALLATAGDNSRSTLVYADALSSALGFVDITDANSPKGLGLLSLDYAPVGVIAKTDGGYALTATPKPSDNSTDLIVVNVANQAIVHSILLQGEATSLAISADDATVVVAMKTTPLAVLDTSNEDPTLWNVTFYKELQNSAGIPDYGGPMHVAIQDDNDNSNICVVTMSNNLMYVDLTTGEIARSVWMGNTQEMMMGEMDLTKDGIISQTETLVDGQLRNPQAVTWLPDGSVAITEQRSWTGMGPTTGNRVIFGAGGELEWEAVRVGHYPEEQTEMRGNEPGNILYAKYSAGEFLFVLSQKASLVFVYDVTAPIPEKPQLLQVLPVGLAPKGILAIPDRNLLVVSSETDDRASKIRSSLSFYEYKIDDQVPKYPTLVSEKRTNNTFIPFSALSGLASAAPYGFENEISEGNPAVLYSIEDSFFKSNCIFTIDTSLFPYRITTETHIMDTGGILATCLSDYDTASIINADNTVNIDPEGISVSQMGGFWLASEGSGTVGDAARPVQVPNLLLKLDTAGEITKCVLLPQALNDIQVRFGFEGVAEDGNHVVVAIQRAWGDEANPRLGIYNHVSDEWKFVFYPLDAPESQDGGWVGLSDIAPLGGGMFWVLERDNKGGPDAAVKRVYQIDLGDFASLEDGATITKVLARDLMNDLAATTGSIFEKVEGLTVTQDGTVWLNNDNDGVDGSNGEQLLLNLGPVSIVTSEPTTSSPMEAPTTAPTKDVPGVEPTEEPSSGACWLSKVHLPFALAVLVPFLFLGFESM